MDNFLNFAIKTILKSYNIKYFNRGERLIVLVPISGYSFDKSKLEVPINDLNDWLMFYNKIIK